ncbi:hypothetical protein [Roseovarius sp. M141]|uniref:hypothetical protein n=1 Tax=Roseovarius sp. M141 TaxID=2583806 RepID=UPI0020CD43A7|nr:hypothetical protein [Roseovarius sp. M141]MCQ0092663.1 hypothetical protein [Roseovarius sp. M141]
MKKFAWLLACTPLLLAACEDFEGGSNAPSGQFIKDLPEGVLALAAPYQDLTAVRIDPTTKCYIYRYAGPVETTFLPLRSVEGRPICLQPADASAAS